MTERSRPRRKSPPQAGTASADGGRFDAPPWAWNGEDGAAPAPAEMERPATEAAPDARPEAASEHPEVETLRRELASERAATAAAVELARRAQAEAVEARRALAEVRSEAAARSAALEQRAEAALIQARADADALNAVALAAQATESRASALAAELAALRAPRRRRWGR